MRGIVRSLCISLIVFAIGSAALAQPGAAVPMAKPIPVSVTISPENPTVEVGKTVRFKAIITDAGGKKIGAMVVWRLTDGSAGSINARMGLFRAGSQAGTFEEVVMVTVPVPGGETLTAWTGVTVRLPFTGVFVGTYGGDDGGSLGFNIIGRVVRGLSFNEDASVMWRIPGKVSATGAVTGRVRSGQQLLEITGQITDEGAFGEWISENASTGDVLEGMWECVRAETTQAGPYVGHFTGAVEDEISYRINGSMGLILYDVYDGLGEMGAEARAAVVGKLGGEEYGLALSGTWDVSEVALTLTDTGFEAFGSFAMRGMIVTGDWTYLDEFGVGYGFWRVTKL
jgi:hypothetical protein